MDDQQIKAAAKVIEEADALMITAGAGMGVDSGLPDFRGSQGFWKAYPPIAKLGMSFSEMANPRWFDQRPKLAWAFYGHRLNLYRQTQPHQGYSQLLEIAGKKPGGYFVFTSNVDGHFQKAGYLDLQVEECHGSINHLQCVAPCQYEIWPADGQQVVVDAELFEATDPLPTCSKCNGLARPNILMFGDWNWIGNRSQEQTARKRDWLSNLIRKKYKLAIIEIGAGLAVPTVRYESEHWTQETGGILVRINPRDAQVPSGHISLEMNGAEGINAVSQLL